ncbi:MAG: ATP-binding protein, partial [Candidatus Hodarchaeota archaeon]
MVSAGRCNDERPIYPFTAIVGQKELKLTLILNAIDPKIGGVLLTGPKGTGKSSIIRAAAEIFPEILAVENCVFGCYPFNPTKMCEECRLKFDENQILPKQRKRMNVITLPLSATEDRVIGSLDVETAVRKGIKAHQPGILAEANQNILYIDEVNLLPDHLVDIILDAAASGWNVIEREGISLTHPSEFVLVGSMNPEEGELRPQILDRFGLHAQAQNILNPKERIEIIQRNENFFKNPTTFRNKYKSQQEKQKRRIVKSKELLPKVQISQSIMESIAKICSHLQIDGYRPDIVMTRVSKALAAYNNREEVLPEDALVASKLVLSHRTRKAGLRPPPTSQEIRKALSNTPVGKEISQFEGSLLEQLDQILPLRQIKRFSFPILLGIIMLFLVLFVRPFFSFELFFQFFSQLFTSIDVAFQFFLVMILIIIIISLIFRRPKKGKPVHILDLAKITAEQMTGQRVVSVEKSETKDQIRTPSIVENKSKKRTDVDSGTKVFETLSQSINPTKQLKKLGTSYKERPLRGKSYLVGKRAPVVTSLSRGRYVWHELPKEKPWNIALGPTIRAAAPYQRARKTPNLSVVIKPQDIKIKTREYRAPFSIIILVDLSLSMVSSIFNLGKAITTLHKNVYRRRDRVGLVIFKGEDAFLLQEPTTRIDLVLRRLWKTGASDLTPMAAGMLKAYRTLKLEKLRNKDAILMLIVISDGIANIPLKHSLSKRSRKKFLSDAQADCIDVARLLFRDSVRTIIINTAHSLLEEKVRVDGKSYIPENLFTPT